MPVVSTEIYNESITTLYADMISIYELDDDGHLVYRLTEDTSVVAHKAYYVLTGTEYVRVPSPSGNPSAQSFYEQSSIHMNSCGEWLSFDDSLCGDGLFGKVDYMPVNFNLTTPNTTSVNEQTGSLVIGGVTNKYIELLLKSSHKCCVRNFLIKVDDAPSGSYIIDAVDVDVDNISISSAEASISISMKSGGILSYYASKYTYNVTNFPGING